MWHSVQTYYLGYALEIQSFVYSAGQRQRAQTEIIEIAVLGVAGRMQLSIIGISGVQYFLHYPIVPEI